MASQTPADPSCESVDVARDLRGDDAVAHLLAQQRAVAQLRIAVAAAAARLLVVDRAPGHAGDQVLVLRHDGGSVGIPEADEIERARPAAEKAERGLEIAVAKRDELRVVGADPEHRLHAEAAAPLAGPRGIGQQLVLEQQVRGLLLEHLVVLVEQPSRRVDHPDVVVTVGAAHGAGAAFQAHEADVDVLVVLFRVDAGGQRAQQVVPAGGHAIGHHRRQRALDRVGIRRAQVVAEGRRLRVRRVEDRAFGDHDLDRLDHALVVRDVRIDHLQQRQDRRRRAGSERAVDEPVGLPVGARVVEPDLALADLDVHADREFRPLVAAVVVDVALARIAAIGNPGDLGFHHAPRRLEQRLLVRREVLEAVLAEQLEQAPLADRGGADLGLHVVAHDVEADVGEDQLPDILAQLALLDHLDRRDAQPFLPDFGRVRVVAAGDRAADVGLVPLDRGPGDEPALEEHRLVHRDVVVLVAEAEHVVVEDDVAGVDLVAEIALDVLAHRRQRERQDRQVLGLLQHAAFGVVEAGDEILGFAQDRRARRLLHRDAHLVGDRLERARVHRQQDRIDLHATASLIPRVEHARDQILAPLAVEHERAVPVDDRVERSGQHHGRRHLLDDRRPGDALAEMQPMPVVDRHDAECVVLGHVGAAPPFLRRAPGRRRSIPPRDGAACRCSRAACTRTLMISIAAFSCSSE